MPIRFRCAYCNQLMGIASRKAGEVVRCPKCAGDIIVPTPEAAEAPDTAPSPKPGNAVFDSPDFDKHLHAETDTAAADADLLPDADQSPHPGLPEMAVPTQRGLFLTPAMLAILAVALLILLAATFVAGFYVARATVPVAIVNS